MSAHTPGPWRCRDSAGEAQLSFVIEDPRIKRVARAWHEADAGLIAAAPDLLEALRMMVAARTRGFLEPWEHEERLDAAVAAARAAIARAEGE